MKRMSVAVVLLAVPFMSFSRDGGQQGISVQQRPANSVSQPYACEEDLIEVMFERDSRVRLRGQALADLTTNALDGVDEVLRKLAWFEWQRITDVAEERLDEFQSRGEANTGKPVYNLNNIYRLRIPKGLDVWTVSRELEALAGIMLARPVPRPMPPPLPPDYEPQQNYLDPASFTPTGIDARYAWTQTGGDGTGVTVCDLEYSWKYNHTDIPKALGSQINFNVADPFSDDNHGTAVIGELVSDNNGWGTTGVCYGASLLTCGTYYGSPTPVWNVPGAMAVAIANLSAGDVILLEQQWDYTGSSGFVPIEWWLNYSPSPQTFNGVYAAITNAVSNGIHVVEAGGNGNVNTDLLSWFGNSGAIIVGAGGAYTGGTYPAGDLERLWFSSYGSRFDLQAWGEDVVTTGYGALYNAEGDTLWYTNIFSGTSSASPIVAGAIANCVGYWTANISPTPPTPAYVRTLLISTGTAQVFPPAGNIGPRPDLAAAFAAMPPPKFTVINTNDTGTGSLRWALTQANATSRYDTIDFNIPGPGPHTIFPLSQLPQITDTFGVFIAGLTQPGAFSGPNPPSTAALMVEVNGLSAGAAHGLWIVSSNNTIEGLVVNSFEQDGIRIEGTAQGTSNNIIFCNFIGTDPSGQFAQGNGWPQSGLWAGVNIIVPWLAVGVADSNTVDANLISANYAEGVGMSGSPSGDVYGNDIMQNYIGTDVTGMLDLGNAHAGVYVGDGTHDNLVDGNLISGNDFEGVCIVGFEPDGLSTFSNTVSNNTIGLAFDLITPLPNAFDGVSIGQYDGTGYQGGYAVDNLIYANTIAHNGGNGVTVWEHSSDMLNADQNQITQNSIYENGLLGIDLGDDYVTPNDTTDPDNGAGQELNFPVIDSAYYSAVPGSTEVWGRIDIDTSPTLASVEVFKARPDPSGYGEGETYFASATPDVAGNWNITLAGAAGGDTLTATVTDMNGNTSEFSATLSVVTVGVEETLYTKLPRTFLLAQNFPNPFNWITEIKYGLPKDGYVRLDIFNVTGQKVATLVEEKQSAGYKNAKWDARSFGSGVYFYRLEIGDYRAIQKMILIR